MDAINTPGRPGEPETIAGPDASPGSPAFGPAPQSDDAPAWEEIAAGRYQPRRIRGSCRGRALG